ncbi:MAG TPA: hypothetical protein VK816_10750 [Jatrophihabitantaceae bacterium]|nr:hypothetical protein [Jatrophihabitantaceae bacterium]
MTAGLPAGFVDPLDLEQVTAVFAAARTQLGIAGLVELVARVPGIVVDPGRPARRLQRAIPATVSSGQDMLRFSEPIRREHVVGGVVISRADVPAGKVAAQLAQMCRDAIEEAGQAEDASVALTAARDALQL